MTSGGNTLSKTERLSGKKSVSTLLADGRWGAHGHFRYCWMARPSHSGSAAFSSGKMFPSGDSDSGAEGALAAAPGRADSFAENAIAAAPGSADSFAENAAESALQGAAAGSVLQNTIHSGGAAGPGRILVSVPKRFFKRAVKRNLLKRRIREAYRIRKMAGVDILFQYNSADLADFAAIQADIAAILSRIQSAMASTTPAGRKKPEFLPEQSETTPAGRKMPESLPEQSETAPADRKMPEFLPGQCETSSADRKMPEFLPEQSETAPAGRKTPQILPEQGETASAGRKTPEILPEQ